jgi:hypothetical protein
LLRSTISRAMRARARCTARSSISRRAPASPWLFLQGCTAGGRYGRRGVNAVNVKRRPPAAFTARTEAPYLRTSDPPRRDPAPRRAFARALDNMTIPVDPGWLSLLPPLVAIALALITREVILSLFAGIWLAALLLVGFNPVTATMMSLEDFILEPLTDGDHMAIILFSLMLGGMVGVMSRSGGAQGIVEALRPFATTRRRGSVLRVALRPHHLLRRLRQHADPRQHDAAHDGRAAHLAREARLHRGLRRGAHRRHRAHLDVGRIRDLADRRLAGATAEPRPTPSCRRSCWPAPRTRSTSSCTRSRTCSIRSSPWRSCC